MEVRLTGRQFEVIRRLFGAERRYEAWFNRAEKVGRYDYNVTAPAIMWLSIRNSLMQRCFTVQGRRSSKVPRFEGQALKRIARGLAEYHIHPALRGEALTGHHGQVLPVWTASDDRYVEFPYDGGDFCLLFPDWVFISGLAVTQWNPVAPDRFVMIPDNPLFLEVEHRAFGIYAEESR